MSAHLTLRPDLELIRRGTRSVWYRQHTQWRTRSKGWVCFTIRFGAGSTMMVGHTCYDSALILRTKQKMEWLCSDY
jgi:hypothetical protein